MIHIYYYFYNKHTIRKYDTYIININRWYCKSGQSLNNSNNYIIIIIVFYFANTRSIFIMNIFWFITIQYNIVSYVDWFQSSLSETGLNILSFNIKSTTGLYVKYNIFVGKYWVEWKMSKDLCQMLRIKVKSALSLNRV